MNAPDAVALLAALPQPAALLDSECRLVAANAAFRAMLAVPKPWRSGEAVAARWPEAAEALAACLSGEARTITLARGEAFRLLPAPPGALLLWGAGDDGEAGRLAVLGRLAGGVAHDFNNLLAIVLGAVGAARGMAPSPALEVELAAIEGAAVRGAGLVRQLLAFARQQVLAPRRVALNDTVREFAALLPRLLGSGIRVELSLEEPARHVRVDPNEWSRVLLNLAVNARDAMGGRGRLSFTSGRRLLLGGEAEGLPPGRYVTLDVCDDGPGIPPQVLAHIFEPFFTTKIEAGGTGLGLATVQGIVGQFGGRITAHSPPGGGTMFRILLPRDDTDQEGEADAARPHAAPVELPSAAGPVLLVDDERSLLRVAALTLRQAGHDVVACEDGEEALEQLRAGLRPTLLATDVAMPGLDGVALAREARAICPGLAVLLLSGYSASTAAGDPRREGFHFLAKPYTPEALRSAVEGALVRN